MDEATRITGTTIRDNPAREMINVMKRRWLKYLNVVGVAVVGLATACGQTGSTQGRARTISETPDANGNVPFRNELNLDRTPLSNVYDPHSAPLSTVTQVQVVTGEGQQVVLDADKQPIIFVAYWCPHCQRTLVMFSQEERQLHQLPVVVSMGFQPGTTLAEAKKLTQEERKTLGLSSDFTVDYALTVQSAKYVPHGFPNLVYSDGTTLQMLYGEHSLSAWKMALDQ